MEEKVFYDRAFPKLSVTIEHVIMIDGKEMYRLVILHLDGNPYVDQYYQTYNGAVIGLFRWLSNSILLYDKETSFIFSP